jgi:hypothetical protein
MTRTAFTVLFVFALISAANPQPPGLAEPGRDRRAESDPATQQQPAASGTQAMYNAAASSAEAKLQHIEENARRNPPDQRPTALSEREINAYLASEKVQLPTGVRSVRFTGQNGVLNTTARVDFDAITAQSQSSNPLLSLFSGVHDVHAVAHASGSGGKGRVDIDSIDIDGVNVPRMALQFFIDHYIRPKHPEVGMRSVFDLPARIDTANIGDHQLVLTQK